MRRRLVLCALLVCWSAVALANPPELAARRPAKGPVDCPPNQPDPDRQGGDTLLDATVIVGLPFESTGSTTGYTDDYDEACPFTGSTSPDVVYTFTLAFDRELTVDMLGSTYDTKIYIYDDNLALIACNDDFYPDYVSRIEGVAIAAGIAHYLVIDGYGGSHGDYVLTMTIFDPLAPCPAIAGCSALREQEPPLEDGYVDVYNGGCNSEEYGAPFLDVVIDPFHGGEFAGVGGWYLGLDGDVYRDTDWLRATMPNTGSFEVEIEAEQPTYLFQLGPTDCGNVTVLQQVQVDPCERASMYVSGASGEEIWLWIGSSIFESPAGWDGNEYHYRISLGLGLGGSCLDLGPQNDYTLGAAEVVVADCEASFSLDNCTGDVDLGALCGGEATPGGDVFASIYLEAGDGVGIAWYPYYILDEPSRSGVCMALVSDLRTAWRSCADKECFSGYNDFGALSVNETGWYWLVIDATATSASQWGNLGFELRDPPIPPPHDVCEGAATLPPGPFTIDDDLTAATNRFDPGRDGCPSAPEVAYTSRDVVYEVTLAAGQTLDVTMTSVGEWEEVLYLVRDCESPLGTCVAAGILVDGDRHLRYTAFDDEVLFLVCDSYGLGNRPFTLTGSIDSTTGTPPGQVGAGDLVVTAAPNPFNPRTRIAYTLPQAGHVRVRIHALDGRLVRDLVDAPRAAGRHEVAWDGRDGAGRGLPSGAYVVRVSTGGSSAARRLLLLK